MDFIFIFIQKLSMGKTELNVLGLSYSQTQRGAYALILEDTVNKKRIPIIIGAFEAQAIAIELEKLKSPRPLTHDLIISTVNAFGIEVQEVFIYRIEEGIFYSEIILSDNKKTIRIDSRTSDAIAIALKSKCKIFVDDDVLQKTGFLLDEKDEIKQPEVKKNIDDAEQSVGSGIEQLSLKELKLLLKKAIEKEDYEKASILRDEIKKREK